MKTDDIKELLKISLEEFNVLEETRKETTFIYYFLTANRLLIKIGNCYKKLGKTTESNEYFAKAEEHSLLNQLTIYVEETAKNFVNTWVAIFASIINNFSEESEDLATTLLGGLDDSESELPH
ncbi:hypothetical protein [Rickettsia endosymbiont of Halotydeus destructor]|uniref:hypothetical protein n=1 Tax=Rickettsia endosymbiont of Halotydeus destructor TaxID=2996754 RepID=UPI003BAEEA45